MYSDHGVPPSPYRLLGPSAAADILQLSSSLPLQSRGRARLLVGNDDVHIIARSDDELLDDFFHDQSTATSQAGKFVWCIFIRFYFFSAEGKQHSICPVSKSPIL